MIKKIIFSSGGTGGHIFPTINLMKYFSNKGLEVLLVTDLKGRNFFEKYSKHRSILIKTETTTNKNFLKKLWSIPMIFFSIVKSILILKREKPNLIFGFGGYVSFPISIASKLFNIPLVIYENNLVLGRTNKFLLPFSKKVLLSIKKPINFPKKYENKIYYVGNILSENIINHENKENKNDHEYFTILVLGGSQGAEIFGKIIPKTIKKLKDQGYQIKINQQCTENQKNSLVEFYNKNQIENNIFYFTTNILELISNSDLAISRCGASTTAELTQILTPFVAVPYPYSTDNHQYLNAKYYENCGCCWILEQNNFNVESLFNLLMEIVKDKKKLQKARVNMKKNGSKNTYIKIENAIKEFI